MKTKNERKHQFTHFLNCNFYIVVSGPSPTKYTHTYIHTCPPHTHTHTQKKITNYFFQMQNVAFENDETKFLPHPSSLIRVVLSSVVVNLSLVNVQGKWFRLPQNKNNNKKKFF